MNILGFPDYEIGNPGNGTLLTFNSGTPDPHGSFWWLDGCVEGWDSPDARTTMLAKVGSDPGADGEIVTDLHYKGRTISFTLYAECPSEAAREASRHFLDEVLDLINASGVFLANESVPLQCAVLRTGNTGQGKVTVTELGFTTKVSQTEQTGNPDGLGGLDVGSVVYPFKAQIELYAQDPRKYTQTPVAINGVSGSAVVPAGGNTRSQALTMTITVVPGGLGPITIAATAPGYSQTMRLVVPTVPSGAPPLSGFPNPVLIDFYNKTIRDAGGVNFYYLRDLTTPWLSFPADGFTLATGPGPQGFSAALFPAFI